ncbi:MAG: carboxylesterase family protein [Gemmataceae bacterium]
MPCSKCVSWCRRFSALLLLATILSLAANTRPARADLFFFKDGFVIEGRVMRNFTLEFDQISRDAYYMPKGSFFLDDGPRRIFFSPSRLQFISEKELPSEERIHSKNPLPGQVKPLRFPGLLEVVGAPDWDNRWCRRFKFRSNYGTIVDVPQHIGTLTPYWAEIESRGHYFWGCAYLTRELGPETVQSLLASHPDFQDKPKQPPEKTASMRLRKADFYAQAGWLDLADKELDRLAADLPTQKERVEQARKTLVKLRAAERYEEIKRRKLAGQHTHVRRLLEDFPTKSVPEKLTAKIEELQHEYKEMEQLLKDTARLLEKTRQEAAEASSKVLRDAAGVIHGELSFENVVRLDAFLGQARQAERLQKAGKKAEISAEQLLGLAISGWVLGSAAAEMSVETALRLWNGRDMVLAYLRGNDPDKRQQMLQQHQAGSRTESASLDELVQIIRTLPPVAAVNPLPQGVAEYKTEGATYSVKLPPEYRHSRPYPVLIVLHQAGEKPAGMIQRWAAAAAENGYILFAPEWQVGANSGYNYSAEEHARVANALRDLRRRFNTDEDRVFLTGLGDGGLMAFDFGLGHPDLFAGVLPMGAGPQFHAELCWRNAQKLPFYVVHGSQAPLGDKLRDLFDNWVIRRPFSSLWIEYKGRGVEWFGGEVQNMFDWMRGQRRYFPMDKLGSNGGGGPFGNEFCTLRSCDNHFYWLSSDDIRYTKDLSQWRTRLHMPPASLDGRIDFQNNKIYVNSTGLGQLTIWLGRNNKGEDMIDFDKPVTVMHGLALARPWVNRKVTPSLEVLLEDLHERGDRQQLFLAKIPLGSQQMGVRTRR